MGAANKLYNGNIAETFWSTATDGGFVRNYGYKYDQLNRLKDATYQKSGQVTGMYNENLSYDKNGNIMNLSRYGDRDEQYLPIQIDNLQYGYATNSNKLMSVVDNSNNTSGFKDGNTTGDDYVYDANGNMTVDKNKNITSIVYNHLNLPTKIIFSTGNIVYIYTASGQKVQKVVTTTTPASVVTTDYLGGYQYIKKTASEPVELQFFSTAEGYVKNTPVSGTNTYSYVFNYTDHLGNMRLSYAKDTTTGSLKILEENNYYPFGLKHNGYNSINPVPENRRLYNGKELQEELGLNMYDYGSRMYDPARAGWSNVDPLAEKLPGWSPYNFVRNNPINRIDPDGRTDFLINGEKRTINDGNDNLTVRNVSQRQFNRLERKFEHGKTPNYNRLLNKVTQKNGYQVSRVITPSWGYSSEYSVEFTSYGKNNKTPYSKHEHRGFYNFAQGLQDSGSKASMVGYGLTLSVVGAEAGIPLATYGGISSGIGSLLQIGMDSYIGNYEEAGKNAAFFAGEKLIGAGVGKYLNKNMTDEGSELGKEIIKQGVGVKTDIAKDVINNKLEGKD